MNSVQCLKTIGKYRIPGRRYVENISSAVLGSPKIRGCAPSLSEHSGTSYGLLNSISGRENSSRVRVHLYFVLIVGSTRKYPCGAQRGEGYRSPWRVIRYQVVHKVL